MRVGLAPPLLALGLLLVASGCRPASRAMARQPRFGGYDATDLFPDGGSARRLPEGVVPRVPPHDGRAPRLADLPPGPPPLEAVRRVDRELLALGRQRYGIWCVPCHDVTGGGDGTVVRRGYPSPPAFTEERLRAASDAHLYRVLTEGLGKMPPYGPHVPPGDRRAIVAWIRVLQRSQHARLEDAPEGERAELLAAREGGDR